MSHTRSQREVILRVRLILLTLVGLLPLGCAQSLPKELRTWSDRDVQRYLSRYGFKGEIEGFSRMGDCLIFSGEAPNDMWLVSGRESIPRRFLASGNGHEARFFLTPAGEAVNFDSWPVTRDLDQSATWYAADFGLCEYVSVYHGPQLRFEIIRIDQPDVPVFTMNSAKGEYSYLPYSLFSTRTNLYLFDDESKEVIVLSKTAKGPYPVVDRFRVPGEFMNMSDDGQWILVWRRGDVPIDPRIGIYLFNVTTGKTQFLGREDGKVVTLLADDFLSRRLAAAKEELGVKAGKAPPLARQ